MAREFAPLGIHVAHVVIAGVIDGGFAARNFPALVAASAAAQRLDARVGCPPCPRKFLTVISKTTL
jgi:hypothetical protein